MEWKKLLSKRLLGESVKNSEASDGRSQYQRDFDRIVFSSAFRRLQDKTQVFPLPESDFVHNRLTHSLEVSCVGRSLGNLVGMRVIEKNKKLKDEFTQFHFGEIVAAACLAHDIGNPPFGHSGEDAISEYFKSGEGSSFKNKLNEKQWNDLVKFEGNAQGFRILTKLQNPNMKGGLRLTCTTLAAFTKYPKESFTEKESLRKSVHGKLMKKFGYFQAEKDLFQEVAGEVGLNKLPGAGKNTSWWNRHPLAFLVEAADDICYRIMDLEDGFRLGLISFKETEELLMPLVNKDDIQNYLGRDEKERIGYLRAKAISELVKELTDLFIDEEKNILSGKIEDDLLSVIPRNKYLNTITEVSRNKIYRTRSVVEREVAGYEVLGGLLDTFITAYNEAYEGHLSPKNRSIINLLPGRITNNTHDDLYLRLMRVIDFVSGMTDSFAVSLFRKLRGISLPGGRVTE